MTYGNAEIGSATFKIAYDGSELEQGLRVADSQMRSFGRTVSVFSGSLLGLLGFTVKLAIDQETAFVGVKKTVVGTVEQYKVLEEQLESLAKIFGISFAEAAKFAEIAGTLGIEIENIAGATQEALKLQVAVPGGDPTTMFRQLARFSALMDDGIENLDRYNAQLVGLGNNFNTTEPEIINLAVRLAPMAKTMRLTGDQTLAWAAAMKVAGINSEAASTSFLRLRQFFTGVMRETPNALKAIMEAAKMTEEELFDVFTSTDDEGIKKLAAKLNVGVEDLQTELQNAFAEQKKSRFDTEFGFEDPIKATFDLAIHGDKDKMSILKSILDKDEHTISTQFVNDYNAFLIEFIGALASASEGDPTYIQNILDSLGFKGSRLEAMITALAAAFTTVVKTHEFTEEQKDVWTNWETILNDKFAGVVRTAQTQRLLFSNEMTEYKISAALVPNNVAGSMAYLATRITEKGPGVASAVDGARILTKAELDELVSDFETAGLRPPEIILEVIEKLNSTEVNLGTLQESFRQAGAAMGEALLPFLCLLYTSPSPRDRQKSRMPSSA